MGQDVGFWKSLRAFYLGHLGKYVPGKAMVVILRAGMIRGPGVDASLAVVSVFFETLTMMAVGALMAAGIVAVWFRGQPLLFWASLGMMAVAGLPTLPPVFRRLVRLVGLGRLKPAQLEKLDGLGYGTVILGWVLNVIGWTILGLSYWAVLRALGAASGESARSVAPLHGRGRAGHGRRVSSRSCPAAPWSARPCCTELMIPHVGGTIALVAAVLLRLVWLAAELAVLAVLSMRRLRRERDQRNRGAAD